MVKHPRARLISKEEAKDVLGLSYEGNLVQIREVSGSIRLSSVTAIIDISEKGD